MAQTNKHGAASTSIYFQDAVLLKRIEALAAICDVSVSRIIEATMLAAMDPLDKRAPSDRLIPMTILVKL